MKRGHLVVRRDPVSGYWIAYNNNRVVPESEADYVGEAIDEAIDTLGGDRPARLDVECPMCVNGKLKLAGWRWVCACGYTT